VTHPWAVGRIQRDAGSRNRPGSGSGELPDTFSKPGDASTPNQGYRIRSIQQATWEYLSGRDCATTSPFRCAEFTANPDSFMEAMLLAEGVSNIQSYEQFFGMMNLALWVNEGIATADRFREIFAHHDIIDP
jgi:hypothetical protein